MKKIISTAVILFTYTGILHAQPNEIHEKVKVPEVVKSALHKQYPEAKNIGWEKQNGNGGGQEGGSNSEQFTTSGNFIEIVKTVLPVSELRKPVMACIKEHYRGGNITEAEKVADVKGKQFYEAEVKGKDVIFDENGNFINQENNI